MLLAVLIAPACSTAPARAGSAPDDAPAPPRVRIAVVGIVAAPDCDPRDAWIAAAVEEVLAWRLRRCGAFSVVPVVRAYQARAELAVGAAQPPSWAAACRPLGATLLITGVAGGPPEAVRLTLTATPLGASVGATEFNARSGRLFDVLDDATRWAAESAGDATAAALAPLALAAPSRSPSALEYYARAIVALRAGNLRDASHYARESFELDPRFRPAVALMGQLELRVDPARRRDALPRLRLLASLARDAQDDYDRADAELELGQLDLLGGATDAARIRFESALATFTGLADDHGRLAALSQLVDWHVAAAAAADTPPATTAPAAGSPPAASAAHALRSAVEQQTALLADAARLGDLLAAGPAANRLALLHELLGEHDRAHALHQRTLEFAERSGSRPTHAAAWLFLGKWYHQQQRLDDAIDALGRCIELVAPDGRPMVRSLLAQVLRARGDRAAALAELRTARTELGADADLNAQLLCMREIAALEMELGHRQPATAALQEARDIANAMRHADLPAIDAQLAAWRAGN